jgi:hypothetical protein
VIYLKSVLFGFLALVVAIVLFPILGVILLSFIHRPPDGGSIGWDPVSMVKQSPFLSAGFAGLIFAVGFFWEFRGLTHR